MNSAFLHSIPYRALKAAHGGNPHREHITPELCDLQQLPTDLQAHLRRLVLNFGVISSFDASHLRRAVEYSSCDHDAQSNSSRSLTESEKGYFL